MTTLSRKLTNETVAERMNPKPLRAASSQQSTTIVPLGEMTITVTLDQLRAYDANPRRTRNPKFDEIKESIRQRGLDSPPVITKRDNEEHFIIRNGGNTRLQVLNELWVETHDEKFFRIQCLFRPWESEVSTLVGHLAENELHGALLFIEKALGVKSAKELFEKQYGKKISQGELSKRLGESGFPVDRSQISRMFDCVEYLLPAIPNILYGGLSKGQIENLLSLRKGLQQVYMQFGPKGADEEGFKDFWLSTLSAFDLDIDQYKFNIVEDTMLGDLSRLIGRDYRMIELDLAGMRRRGNKSSTTPTAIEDDESSAFDVDLAADQDADNELASHPTEAAQIKQKAPAKPKDKTVAQTTASEESDVDEPPALEIDPDKLTEEEKKQKRDNLTISSTESRMTPAIKRAYRAGAEALGAEYHDFDALALHAMPLQHNGPFCAVVDVWHIEPIHDNLNALRSKNVALAASIAHWGGCHEIVGETKEGLGFFCAWDQMDLHQAKQRSVYFLLTSLLRLSDIKSPDVHVLPSGAMSQVLVGGSEIKMHYLDPDPNTEFECVPDGVFVLFLRLLRQSRRIVELMKEEERRGKK